MANTLKRNSRLGEFKLLILAVLLVAVALSTVGTFGDRMEKTMQSKTSALLGADAMISSARPLSEDYIALAHGLNVEVAQSISFLSMAISDEESQLAGVRAVTSNYPLRGQVTLQPSTKDTATIQMERGPAQGSVWTAMQLVSDLNLESNPNLSIGELPLKFEGSILIEPEGGAGMLRFAPRVIMNLEDAKNTGLLAPGSRARYRFLFAGNQDALNDFESQVVPILKEHERWQIADIRREEVRATVGRIVSYVRLAILLSVILSVVAMSLAAQGLWGRQVTEIALLRCLGQSHRSTFRSVAKNYFLTIIPTVLIGVGIGFVVQEIAARFVHFATGISLSPASLLPSIWALLLCILAASAVVLPLIFAIRKVPAMSLLRVGQTDRVNSYGLILGSIAAFIVVITMLLSRDLILGALVLLGILGTAVLMWILIRLFIHLVSRLTEVKSGPGYVALKSISANGNRSAWIASTFGSIAFALVLLGIIRVDVLNTWQNSIPDNAPNLFLINIKEVDREPLERFLEDNGVGEITMYAIIRGRIAKINGVGASELKFDSEDSLHRINHEYNMTESSELPGDNKIISGQWFKPELGNPELSIEADTAEVLSLKVGDEVTLDVAGVPYTAAVTSIRQVNWESMRSNFYLIASPGFFKEAPRTFVSGIHVSEDLNALVSAVGQNFQSVTAINLEMIISRFKSLVTQGSEAISMVFLFTLLSAALVFVGILQGQRTSRSKEIALLKTMGARTQFIRKSTVYEFAILGGIAGLIGSTLAVVTGIWLANYLFDLEMSVPLEWILSSTLIGMIIVAATGYTSIHKILKIVPKRLLMEESGYLGLRNT